VSEWEPATDAEVAMRDALRTDDQESYFRILSGVDLLLPVSAEALQGLAPLGWGTWSTGGRTHVLAFTSTAALQACLADYSGSARRVPYAELANTWPNLEWWLAVNPGLPVEGYLPAWFVAQLSRGDLRLPTRGPGRDKAAPPGRIQDLHSAAMAANEAAVQQEASAPQPVTGPPAAAPVSGHPRPMSAPPTSAPPAGFPSHPASAPPAGYPSRPMSVPAAAAAAYPQPISAPPVGASSPASLSGPMAGPPGYAQAAAATRMPQFPAADEQPADAQPQLAQPQLAQPQLAQPQLAQPQLAQPQAQAPRLAPPPAGTPEKPQIGPGGLPIRSPGGVMPSGLPSRASAAAPTSAAPTSAAPTSVPSAYRPPTVPPESTTGGWPTFQPGEDPRGPLQDLGAPLPVRTPMANTPPVPEHLAGQPAAEPPMDPRWSGPASALPELPRRQAAPPADDPARGGFPQGPASPQAAAAAQHPGLPQAAQHPAPIASPQPAAGFGSPLPRRQATSASDPAPMTSFPAFKTPAERAFTAEAQAAAPATARPGITPPVIPGSPGSDRPARLGAPQPPPLEVRGATSAPPSRPVGPPPSAQPPAESFLPANDVERELFHAADGHNTDQFLSTLLLASVLVPVAHHSRPGSAPGESGFAFRTEEMDGETFLVVFTSRDRLADHYAEPTRTVSVRFYELIRNWPDPVWSFAVNPGGPIGAKYPGPQVIALASWAAEAGLGAESAEHDEPLHPVPAPAPANDDAQHATVMQKTVPPEHVDFYLERGYDRVAGFVHRATEVEHLRTPAELFAALGLTYSGSNHQTDAKEAYVLRWPAYRPSLYRIPYGGQNEQALKAMDGWVIERAPFRGNGFAPGEGRDVIAEFKVDSVRLPHGAQLWRIDADGAEHMIAIFDNDGPQWRRVGEQ